MKKTLIKPSFMDVFSFACMLFSACPLGYVAYLMSWDFKYDLSDLDDIKYWHEFNLMGGLPIYLMSIFFMIFGIEVFLRRVIIDKKEIRSYSPLRIYRQKFEHDEVELARKKNIFRWGDIVEFKVKNKWIVFCSNRNFKRVVHNYYPVW